MSYSFIYHFAKYTNRVKPFSVQEIEKDIVLKERQRILKDTWSINIYSQLCSSKVLNKKDILEQVIVIFGVGTLIAPTNHTYQPGSTDGIESKAHGLVVRFLHTVMII